MISGFRDFIMRGNVVDLAVAFVIGAAFATVATSFVTHVLTPLLGIVGVPNLEQLSFTLGPAEVRYGLFLNALIAFLLIAAAIYFFVVVPINRMKGPAAIETKTCPECASEIPLAARRCPMCTRGPCTSPDPGTQRSANQRGEIGSAWPLAPPYMARQFQPRGTPKEAGPQPPGLF